MAWADGNVSTAKLMRNWTIVFIGNLIGGFAMAVLADLSGAFSMNAGAVGDTAIAIAEAKIALAAAGSVRARPFVQRPCLPCRMAVLCRAFGDR